MYTSISNMYIQSYDSPKWSSRGLIKEDSSHPVRNNYQVRYSCQHLRLLDNYHMEI